MSHKKKEEGACMECGNPIKIGTSWCDDCYKKFIAEEEDSDIG